MIPRDLSVNDRAPYQMREGWYCIVDGDVHGPWPDEGSARAGYETEQRRAEIRDYDARR